MRFLETAIKAYTGILSGDFGMSADLFDIAALDAYGFAVDNRLGNLPVSRFDDSSESLARHLHPRCGLRLVKSKLVGKPERLDLVDGQHDALEPRGGNAFRLETGELRYILYTAAAYRPADPVLFHNKLIRYATANQSSTQISPLVIAIVVRTISTAIIRKRKPSSNNARFL